MPSRTRLKNLHRENPHCHWCGVLTTLYARPHARNRATLDHLFPRHDWRRRSTSEKLQKVVVACYPCNHGRGSQPFIDGMEKPCDPVEPESQLQPVRIDTLENAIAFARE